MEEPKALCAKSAVTPPGNEGMEPKPSCGLGAGIEKEEKMNMNRYAFDNTEDTEEMSDLEQSLEPVIDPGVNPAYYGQSEEDTAPDPEELLDGYIQVLKALNYDNENIAYAAGTTLERVLEVVGED